MPVAWQLAGHSVHDRSIDRRQTHIINICNLINEMLPAGEISSCCSFSLFDVNMVAKSIKQKTREGKMIKKYEKNVY